MKFDKKIALFHQAVNDQNEAFELLTKQFVEADVVQPDFLEGIKEREKNYPTGLQSDTVGFAIPHTDSKYVKRNQLGFMSLDKPVVFKSMADPDEDIQVELIIMMAIQGHDQAEMLGRLMEMFMNEEIVNKLKTVNDFDSFYEIVKEAGLDD